METIFQETETSQFGTELTSIEMTPLFKEIIRLTLQVGKMLLLLTHNTGITLLVLTIQVITLQKYQNLHLLTEQLWLEEQNSTLPKSQHLFL